MTEKRYQVFISSTYVYLKEERQAVTKAVMDLDCIPAGMELFPAADQQQLEFIYKIIDDCDYYILIVGNRYGSLNDEGISYTQKEYEYAIRKNIPVIAFIRNLDETTLNNSDHPERLHDFRSMIQMGRITKPWDEISELPSAVMASLTRAIKITPGVGWIRGDKAASNEILNDINELRKENDNLKKKISELMPPAPDLNNIADLDQIVDLAITYRSGRTGATGRVTKKINSSLREIFSSISPLVSETAHDSAVKQTIAEYLFDKIVTYKGYSPLLNDQDFWGIRTHFEALGLISLNKLKTVKGGYGIFWSLTSLGQKLHFEERTIKYKNPDQANTEPGS